MRVRNTSGQRQCSRVTAQAHIRVVVSTDDMGVARSSQVGSNQAWPVLGRHAAATPRRIWPLIGAIGPTEGKIRRGTGDYRVVVETEVLGEGDQGEFRNNVDPTGAKIAESGGRVGKQMPDDDQDGGRYRDQGLEFAAPFDETCRVLGLRSLS